MAIRSLIREPTALYSNININNDDEDEKRMKKNAGGRVIPPKKRGGFKQCPSAGNLY